MFDPERLIARLRALDWEVLRFTVAFAAVALLAVGGAAVVSLAAGVYADHVFVQREAQADFPAKAELRRLEDQELSNYGWADREAGLVRIPIDKAMALEVQAARKAGK